MIFNVQTGKRRINKNLKEEMVYLSGKVDDITVETDRQEQSCRRNGLLKHYVPKNKNKDTDVLTMEVMENKMDIKIRNNDIDRTHRIEKQKKQR